MSERHWQRPALASTALALLGATAVAGCGGSASSSQASANQTAGAATATATATAEAGDYGALPDVKTSKQTMHGVKVTPARCAQATVTGFNSAAFTHAPA